MLKKEVINLDEEKLTKKQEEIEHKKIKDYFQKQNYAVKQRIEKEKEDIQRRLNKGETIFDILGIDKVI